jgi:pilus assembly protein CpaB
LITKRLTLAFIVALVVSGIFTLVLSRKVSKSAPPPPPKSQYVAAAGPVEAGQALRAENLKLIEWPASMPLQGAFTTPESLVGRVVLYPLAVGEPVLERQLSSPGTGVGLTVKIPDGMRAISLKSDEVVGVAGFLLPGTHIDVLVTLHALNSPETLTSTVLQDAEVLASGQKTQPDPEGKAITATVVTLLVKPEDAERVVLASTQGTLHFVLRNGADRVNVEGKPVQLSQLTGGVGVPPPPVIIDRSKLTAEIRPVIAKTYAVETTLGSKQRMDTFQ